MSRSTSPPAVLLLLAALALAGCSSGQHTPAASSRTTAASATASASDPADAPGQHVMAATVAAPLASAALLTHAIDPVMAADDAGGLVLAAQPSPARDTHPVVALVRDAAGRWTTPTVLTLTAYEGGTLVAAGGHGGAVVGWGTNGRRVSTETVRVRDSRGHWGAPHVVASNGNLTVLLGLDMNRRGDVAALVQSNETVRVVSRIGGRWTATAVPSCGVGDLALDDSGVVHVACISAADRGEQGPAQLWTQRPGKPLAIERSLGPAAELSLQVTPDGRETVVLGVATPGSTDATGELVGAGSYRVLRQASVGGPLTTVWSHTTMGRVVVAGDGDRLQVAWEEYGRRVRRGDRTVPAPTALQTQAVLPAAGPVTTVSRRSPTRSGRPDAGFDFALAVPTHGPGALVWRAWLGQTENHAAPTSVTPLVGTGATATVVLPGAARDVVDAFVFGGEQLAVTSDGQVFATWLHDAVTRVDGEGDRVTVDGTVQVARLHP